MRPYSVGILATTVLLGGCSEPRIEPDGRPAEAAPEPPEAAPTTPLIATDTGWRLAPVHPGGGWRPIHEGVAIAPRDPGSDDTAVVVSYERAAGVAAGVAYVLPPGATEGLASLIVSATARREQRLHVCLTDADGIVWTFPTIRLSEDGGRFELLAAAVRPDPFQNHGRTPPASPDWGAMRMLTILDITGFMGAPGIGCEWTISRVEGVIR